MTQIITGTLSKMHSELGPEVQYYLPVGDTRVHLNPYLGKTLSFSHTGNIYCDACGKKTKKSYSQGHCFPCMKKLARCDMCIMKPETCHFAKGTCREPEWAEQFCMTDHFIYLSNTSALKVGITRHSPVPTRWIDQGATQALPIFRVSSRQLSGLIEVALAKHVADKTNWRAMLKGDNESLDLPAIAQQLIPEIESILAQLSKDYPDAVIEKLDADVIKIQYPVLEYPTKISSFNLDKAPEVSGTLLGVKGQYLIFDTGVINVRKFSSYEIEIAQ